MAVHVGHKVLELLAKDCVRAHPGFEFVRSVKMKQLSEKLRLALKGAGFTKKLICMLQVMKQKLEGFFAIVIGCKIRLLVESGYDPSAL